MRAWTRMKWRGISRDYLTVVRKDRNFARTVFASANTRTLYLPNGVGPEMRRLITFMCRISCYTMTTQLKAPTPGYGFEFYFWYWCLSSSFCTIFYGRLLSVSRSPLQDPSQLCLTWFILQVLLRKVQLGLLVALSELGLHIGPIVTSIILLQ
jgi:hypothetical protein